MLNKANYDAIKLEKRTSCINFTGVINQIRQRLWTF